MRGLQDAAAPLTRGQRYNPACAGTTRQEDTRRDGTAIQPRVCGDYEVKFRPSDKDTDTTPRVRGLHFIEDKGLGFNRYNPACAGTTA